MENPDGRRAIGTTREMFACAHVRVRACRARHPRLTERADHSTTVRARMQERQIDRAEIARILSAIGAHP
jgi:hypothetical protein